MNLDCFDGSCAELAEPLTPERLARIAKALGNPARVKILEQFVDHTPRTVADIVDGCPLAQSTVSEHLRILREAGVLIARPDGPRTWYCMRRSMMVDFARAVQNLTFDLTLAEPDPGTKA